MPSTRWMLIIFFLPTCHPLPATLTANSVNYFKLWHIKFSTVLLCKPQGRGLHGLNPNVSPATVADILRGGVVSESIVSDFSEENTLLMVKEFSAAFIRSNFVTMRRFHAQDLINSLKNPYYRTAVVFDALCNDNATALQMVSSIGALDLTHNWLIFAGQTFSLQDLEHAVSWAEPEPVNATEYLNADTDKMVHKNFVKKTNMDINRDLLRSLRQEKNKENFTEPEPVFLLKELATIRAMADSEVVIAIPDDGEQYTLYDIHRLTNHSKMVITPAGILGPNTLNQFLQESNAVLRRQNFQGTTILAAMALLRFDYVSRSGELTFRDNDAWAQIGLQLAQLVEERLNYRMLIKTFDDYGWAQGDGFSGMLNWFWRQKVEMGANGMLIHEVRMPAADFIHPLVEVKLGILYRVPTLSQVSNIFILPFSLDVWLSLFSILIISGSILYCQLRANHLLNDDIHFNDVLSFIAAAALQQGSSINATILSVRFTMLVTLVFMLFLFTSYAANIVTLLQTPSNKIHNVQDIVDSGFDVSIENLPFERNMFKADGDPAMRAVLARAVSHKNEDDRFMNASTGLVNVKKGLFAFHVDLPTAYKIISETYTEREKCGLKTLTTYPLHVNAALVPKRSPLKEHLAQKFCALRETGFMYRVNNRWSAKQPRCEQQRAGYANVGIADVLPVFIMFAYGVSLSIVILFVEKFICIWKPELCCCIGEKRNRDIT